MTILSEPTGLGLPESASASRGWRGKPTLTLVATTSATDRARLKGLRFITRLGINRQVPLDQGRSANGDAVWRAVV